MTWPLIVSRSNNSNIVTASDGESSDRVGNSLPIVYMKFQCGQTILTGHYLLILNIIKADEENKGYKSPAATEAITKPSIGTCFSNPYYNSRKRP